jgi:DNA polymerase III gamma/tau subunit
MNSMPNPEQADPHDVAVAALKQAREQIGRADKQLPRVDEQVSRLGPGAARKPSGQQKRLAVPDRRSSRGRLALLGLIGLLLAACVCVAALAWQSPYGDAAKLVIARWAPQRVSISSLPLEKQELPAQPRPPAVDVAANAALPQPAPLAQTPPQDVAPTAAPPELAQWLQTMARDLANVEQGIEQLKTSQEQMVRDNANLAEQLKAAQAQMARDNENAAAQLKASQEQITRLIAKASEQNLRPKTSAPPPRPIATPTRKPVPKLSSPQARARPLAPVPLEPKPPEQE